MRNRNGLLMPARKGDETGINTALASIWGHEACVKPCICLLLGLFSMYKTLFHLVQCVYLHRCRTIEVIGTTYQLVRSDLHSLTQNRSCAWLSAVASTQLIGLVRWFVAWSLAVEKLQMLKA